MIDHADVWLLRHGHALDQSDSNTRAQDAARPLSGKGRRQSRRAGRLLAHIAPAFDAIFSSPAVRCVETAQIVSDMLGVDAQVKPARGEPPSSGNVAPLVKDGRAVLIVGHGHYLPTEIRKLTGRDVEVKKGGVAAITITDGQGRLGQLLGPADIKSLL
jgi:phosphohistidine phosphatase